MPRPIINIWQTRRLYQLLILAKETIPLYKKLWRRFGIDVRTIRTTKDLSQLPIVTKDTFRQNSPEDYINDIRTVKPIHWKQSSGTTGEPFKFVNIRASLPREHINFLTTRFLLWEGFSLSDIVYKVKIARTRVNMPLYNHPNRCLIPVKNVLEQPKKTIRTLLDFKGDIIESYPTLLAELIKMVTENRVGSEITFQYAISFGETLFPSQRADIEKVLHCEVYNSYGLEEMGAIGMECRYHKGFHLHSESFILEIVDERGNVVPKGKRGRVVITDLYNLTMPFIRYAPGDYGRLITEPCPCGLETDRFLIEGRHGFFLELAHAKVHHFEIEGIINTFAEHILQYQIVKQSSNYFRVLIRPAPSFGASVCRRLRDKLRERVGEGVRFTVESTNSLSRTQKGKSNIIVK